MESSSHQLDKQEQEGRQLSKLVSSIDNLEGFTKSLFKKAQALTGYNIDADKRAAFLPLLQALIYNNFPKLNKAVTKGALGEYGEFQGLAPATFNKWFRAYKNTNEYAVFLRGEKEEVKMIENKFDYQKYWDEAVANFDGKVPTGATILLFNSALKLGKLEGRKKELADESREAARIVRKLRIEQAKEKATDIMDLRIFTRKLEDEKGEPFKLLQKTEIVKILLMEEAI
jgi:hypothetical protein